MSSVIVAFIGNIFFVLGLWAYSITLNPIHAFGAHALGIIIQYAWDDIEKNKIFKCIKLLFSA